MCWQCAKIHANDASLCEASRVMCVLFSSIDFFFWWRIWWVSLGGWWCSVQQVLHMLMWMSWTHSTVELEYGKEIWMLTTFGQQDTVHSVKGWAQSLMFFRLSHAGDSTSSPMREENEENSGWRWTYTPAVGHPHHVTNCGANLLDGLLKLEGFVG